MTGKRKIRSKSQFKRVKTLREFEARALAIAEAFKHGQADIHDKRELDKEWAVFVVYDLNEGVVEDIMQTCADGCRTELDGECYHGFRTPWKTMFNP